VEGEIVDYDGIFVTVKKIAGSGEEECSGILRQIIPAM
jgi:hypothetical protein